MDANRAVWNGMFFRWIFFGRFAEDSSFFFSALFFCGWILFRSAVQVSEVWGDDYKAAQVRRVKKVFGF